MATTVYSVPGMTCEHCVAAVDAEVRKVPGVTDVAVDLATKEVRVIGEPARDDVVAAIDEAGYDVAS
ncbi:MAG TPA: heavy metal-associated domain-containing protein [Acidimicrobiales bacterium]|nr:heavy metal-associated domain-containing protein [Acidimicrobiales bacterium]